MTNTRTIARNAGWYGIETTISLVVSLFTSIAIARTLGPTKNGYIVYVSFIAGVVSNLGGFGIPAATRKYMAEFIGMGDRGTAKYIYTRTLLLQILLSTLATGGLLFWVLRDAVGAYKLASVLIVLSIWPAMVNSISAQANVATEDLMSNMPASVLSALTYFITIAATVVLHWGVIGVGASLLSMRAVDFFVRVFPTYMRVTAWENSSLFPAELKKRMISFSWQSVVSMTVALIVWNRSEVILLKNFCADIRQVAYYSVAFSMADQLLLGATIFGSAAGATVFAQYGRDKSRLPDLTSASFRYLALTSIPLHFIATALAVPALLLIYGHQYAGAAMVATLAPLLCMPKAFAAPVQSLLQSTERQSIVILATALAGIVDIGVAWILIPAHGAVGACIGSGAAQVVAIGIMWGIAIRIYKVKLPWMQHFKVVFCSVLAALAAHYVAVQFATPLWAILFGGAASLVVLFGLFYLARVLEPEDYSRLRILSGMAPGYVVRPMKKFLALMTRPPEGSTSLIRKYPYFNHSLGVMPVAVRAYRKHLPAWLREQMRSIEKHSRGMALKIKLTAIPVAACLQGGDNGVAAATFARMSGDLRRASRPISEWPHVKLLREYDRIGERLWDQEVFEKTDYYRNAVLNVEIFGNYFDAFAPDQIQIGARRFVNAYRGINASHTLPELPNYERDSYEYVAVHPVKDSVCFQVSEGHHRLAIAYMKGIKRVSGLILKPAVTTPLQDLLSDVLWLNGRRELYQPVRAPEVAGWILVRRCSDRLAKMTKFLSAEGLMPPVSNSYLDVASSYGWFVAEMAKAGFNAEGVERDPTAIAVGRLMYDLRPEQVHRADAVTLLRGLQQQYDITSCFSLAHHFVMRRQSISAEELLRLMDSATRRVMFFDMGQEHEYPGSKLERWDADYIHRWLEANTTFTRIVRLGPDEDAVPPNQFNFGRMLFACVR
jgi:O-antigen/teichoic acid export membrane protein